MDALPNKGKNLAQKEVARRTPQSLMGVARHDEFYVEKNLP